MLGLDYGSDNSDEEEAPHANHSSNSTLPIPPKAALIRGKKRGPAIITVEAPKPTTDNDERPAKKPKLGPAGKSSLLAMLPAPTNPTPAAKRVLGGGGGVGLKFTETASLRPPPPVSKATVETADPSPDLEIKDFFSLGTPSVPKIPELPPPSIPPLLVSSAPSIQEYQPPEPSLSDPYPGYYQLPSGQWAAYEPEYYRQYWLSTQQPGLAEQGGKGWEKADEGKMLNVDARDEIDRARKEIEERKAVTARDRSVASVPKMTVNSTKTNTLARSRHQLTTLLLEAYQNREALEERIAQAKRNRKEAGNKYGF